MLRNWRKKVRAQRLGTPVKTKQGTYLVPCTEYVRADGEVRREIHAKSIMLAVIADELGTDDPDVVMREYTRREFVAYVRRSTETEDERERRRTEGPQLPPVYHKPGKIIAFPGTEVEQSRVQTTPAHQSETLGRANILARPADVVPQSESAQTLKSKSAVGPEPIIDMPVKKQPTEAELIAAAIEDLLKLAETDEDRRLLNEYLEQHQDYVRSAVLDDHVRLSLSIYNGIVCARYARYAQAICEA